MTTRCYLVVGLACLASACGNSSNSTTGPTPTPAAASIIEPFTGVLPVGGTRFYSFTVGQYGTVNLTLNSLSGGSDDPSTLQIGLGVGRPSGITCAPGSTLNTVAGTGPQVSSAYDPGVYCARITDVGNLVGSTAFDITIAHP